jgi:serine/threonine protein kinase
VLNISIQLIELVEKLHKLGYLHRDLKPANFLLGHGNKKDKIYLIDFGLARKLKPHQEEADEFKERKNFVGTKRFASISSHLGLEQSKKDDLECLGYSLVFLLKGRLPWQGLRLPRQSAKCERVGELKQEMEVEELCKLEVRGEISYNGGNHALTQRPS